MGKINNIGRKVQKGGSAVTTALPTGTANVGVETVTGLGAGVTEPVASVAASAVAMPAEIAKNLGIPVPEAIEKALPEAECDEKESTEIKPAGIEEEEFWDTLWEEPCWIDPDTNTFQLSKIWGEGNLWCTWQSKDNPIKAAGALMDNKTVTANLDEIKKKAKKKLGGDNPNLTDFDNVSRVLNNEDLLTWKDIVSKNRRENIKKDPKFHLRKALGMAGLSKCDIDDILSEDLTEKVEAPAATLMGANATAPGEAQTDSTSESKCDWKKLMFCLWLKCLLGPAGYLVLKMLPHFIKFCFTTKNVLHRIVYALNNITLNAIPILKGVKPLYIPYINKDGDIDKYAPDLPDLLLTYLGTVFPFQFIDHDMGEKYGKGKFGKIILGLVMVSVALITIGGIGITMLLLTFSFYCIKVIGMFSDNIQDKKKK